LFNHLLIKDKVYTIEQSRTASKWFIFVNNRKIATQMTDNWQKIKSVRTFYLKQLSTP
jgi:hypothetical protein